VRHADFEVGARDGLGVLERVETTIELRVEVVDLAVELVDIIADPVDGPREVIETGLGVVEAVGDLLEVLFDAAVFGSPAAFVVTAADD
jgi:hypothetical protein